MKRYKIVIFDLDDTDENYHARMRRLYMLKKFRI